MLRLLANGPVNSGSSVVGRGKVVVGRLRCRAFSALVGASQARGLQAQVKGRAVVHRRLSVLASNFACVGSARGYTGANPSIERTSQSRLRPLCAAAHVER